MALNHSFRTILLATTLVLYGLPSAAETFQNRNLEIFDGRGNKGNPAPLVVAMHGFLGTSKNMRRKTGFDALARKHGFTVVYPNGKRRSWNDGRSPRNEVDDVSYLASLFATLISNRTAARGMIFLTGHSNGGGMAMRMACERPDLVAGIAVVVTKTPINFQCANGVPVPAIFIFGTEDPISPHGGRPASSRLGGALSGRATINLWTRRNQCSNSAQTSIVDRREDGTPAKIFRFKGCAAALTYVEIEGHGHGWPGPGNRSTRLQGPASQEIDAASMAWRFFESQFQ